MGYRRLDELDRRIYREIEEYILKNGYAPTYREIAQKLNVSVSTINYHMRKLKITGLVQCSMKHENSFRSTARALNLPSIKMEKRPEPLLEEVLV